MSLLGWLKSNIFSDCRTSIMLVASAYDFVILYRSFTTFSTAWQYGRRNLDAVFNFKKMETRFQMFFKIHQTSMRCKSASHNKFHQCHSFRASFLRDILSIICSKWVFILCICFVCVFPPSFSCSCLYPFVHSYVTTHLFLPSLTNFHKDRKHAHVYDYDKDRHHVKGWRSNPYYVIQR